MPENSVVVVHIECGCVAGVEQPPGVDVHIIDMDTAGADKENLCRCELVTVIGRPHLHVEYPGDPETDRPAYDRLMAAASDLLAVAGGALGYLEALPVTARPDAAWFKPLRAAVVKGLGSPEAR